MIATQRRKAGLAVALALSGVTLLTAGGASNSQLESRVTKLEAQVVALTTRVTNLEASPAPSASAALPSPSATPGAGSTAMAGQSASPWTLAFSDDFSTWDASRYFVYPATWTNNYTGRYDPSIISSDGSKLRLFIHTDSTGTPRIAAFCPLPTGSLSGRGDLPSMRVEFRIRADRMVGYKGVPLLWPMSGVWPRDGETDFPESHFDAQPAGFLHYQGAYISNGIQYGPDGSRTYQKWIPTPAGTSWQDWHTYAIEWVSGTYIELFVDGVSIGRSTTYIPNTPMHLVLQFETQLNMTKPAASVQGYVEIDDLRVWGKAA